MRLAAKLSLIVLVVTLACGAATSLLVSRYAMKMLQQRMLDDVAVVVEALSPHLADAVLNEDPVSTREILEGLVSEPKGLDFAYLVKGDGDVLAHTFAGSVPGGLPREPAENAAGGGTYAFVPFDDRGTSYLVGRYPLFRGADIGAVHVGINRNIFDSEIRRISILILSLSLAVSVAGILVALPVADRMTRPLSDLARAIGSFGKGAKTFSPMTTGGTEVLQLSAAFHEMVKSRNEAGEALRFQRALLEAQSETGIDGILTISPEGDVVYHNRRFLEMWSIPDGVDKSLDERLLAAVLDRLADPAGFLKKVRYLYDHPDEKSLDEVLFKDGRTFERYSSPLPDAAGGSYGRIWFFRDITARRRAEEERIALERRVLHVQKLESLGVLAGGIAHDFNNILSIILGNANLALMRIDGTSRAADNLRRIEAAAARASDLARQMLAYSGKGAFLLENVDLNRLLEEMLHLIEVSISKNAVLRTELDRTIPAVEVDATQIRQVVMNLVINASEAIGDSDGVISIATGRMTCDGNDLKDALPIESLREGVYVFLEVTDTGCGMDRETMGRIFDPFFSTKFAGRGLGMSAVLGIVGSHNGAIKVRSEPGGGSTFTVLLPASGKPAEIRGGEGDAGRWKGEGTVLVVDDEEAVRATESEMVRSLGFRVLAAEDGRRALEMYKARKDIDVVICDLTMPRMGGEQCLRELRAHDPDVKVILSSGYNEQEVMRNFTGGNPAGFLQKPFTMAALMDALGKVLPAGTGKGDSRR